MYETLARVAIKSQEKDLAIQRLNEALQISKRQVMRLADVDTIAAQIRLDEMQSGYLLKEERFKREKLWLIFSLVLAALISITGGILYRSIRQKRRLEQILFESQKSELSYFNSHHLRRHVANILGIVDMIRHSALPYETYAEAEPHLFRATEDLDQSIREITAKLGD
ncbi:hypothetical protein [Mucilaginibacter aquariorum]|uniref:hypothetical protein n=1 Tax=Mucilaginibacter aquariorum TaxID=2967225 RepID=UPI00211417CB|nr:hypothetical protein [Mucilaginibacter aquariorum]